MTTITTPVVFERDGQVFANSRDVAEFFSKRHDNVLADVGSILKSQDTPADWFIERPVVNEQNGQTYRTFDMTRDGFTLLVMGYTGPKAMQFKIAYIGQFNAMEATLKNADPMAALNDPAAMRGLLLTYTEKVIALEAKVAEAQPTIAAFDRIASTDNSLCITDAAKHLQVKPKQLTQWLQANGWIYKRAGGKHWIGYQDKINSLLLEHKQTEVQRDDGTTKVTEQVRVTNKGLARIARAFSATVTAQAAE
ncbi:MAG: hypothetical protein VR70_06020 [Rhodospirillaceae bacterium BRH_c57]|nr:MAG: hypothetical protein VR70_06020 [Rhodospirillaceae bacterium BRH_c57]